MAVYEMRLPDIGEGITEAEISEWHVKPGDLVAEDDILAAVMTDKAAVEVPSVVEGKVLDLACEVGESLAIGSVLVRIDVAGAEGGGTSKEVQAAEPETAPQTARTQNLNPGAKPLAAPSVRAKARAAGVDLRAVAGTGPAGRIRHEDFDAHLAAKGSGHLPNNPPTDPPQAARSKRTGTTEIRVVGMRRKIAEKMVTAKRQIPHITLVDEVDMEALEDLRGKLNARHAGTRPKLTLLPFLARALVEALRDSPEMNARYDDEAGVIHRHEALHLGVAAQTSQGLTVPVLRHAEALSLWEAAAEIARLAEAARAGSIKREELSGGTLTISSLGALGGLVSTPIINHPEVAVIGVNKMQVRPVWDGTAFQPRKMMNLSASFDHRVIDGWDAGVFMARLKELLETPALLFVEG
ncbi:MAG: dihydrolipoamide acetyltransferase family protein [Pseudomonadota bacterium]